MTSGDAASDDGVVVWWGVVVGWYVGVLVRGVMVCWCVSALLYFVVVDQKGMWEVTSG